MSQPHDKPAPSAEPAVGHAADTESRATRAADTDAAMGSTAEFQSSSAGDADFQLTTPSAADSLAETQSLDSRAHLAETQAAAAVHAPDGWIGQTIGKYQVTGVLGQGGMGIVLRARDPMIEREVAIKLLARHWAQDPTALARLLGEAKAVGKLSHPNVCGIFEIGQEGADHFLVMEFLPGGSLSQRLESQGRLSLLEATQALVDACRGVAAAHAAGMVHRDIKPANFMRAADGSIKVMDFGLAKSTMADGASAQLTQAGLVVGTPFFMSPEQCEGKPLDERSDVYSLGATYYCLLSGRQPYDDSDSIPRLMYNHCHGPILDPRAVVSTIPPACSVIVARAMAKSPADRYPSADAMLADLLAVAATLSGQTKIELPSQSGANAAYSGAQAAGGAVAPPRRTALDRRWVLAAGIAVLAAGAAMFAIQRRGPAPPAGDATAEAAAPLAAAPLAPVLAGEPIRVGVLHSMSGTMAVSEAVVIDAFQFAFDEINHSGGLLGRPIEPIFADGRSDEAVFAREARRLIVEEGVVTVFGCWTSASRKAVRPVVEEHDHLLVYPLQYEGLETSPNIVYVGAAPNQQILPAVEWAIDTLGKSRFFLIGSDYVFPRCAHQIIRDLLEARGCEVVGEAFLPLGSPDALSAVEAIVAARPDMILSTINGDTNIAFFRDLRRAGIEAESTPVVSFSIAEQGLRSLNAAELEGHYCAWPYFQSLDTPENVDLVRAFRAEYPQRVLTDPMMSAWIGVRLWAQAVTAAESIEPAKIRRALANQRMHGPAGDVRVDPDTLHCFRTPRIGQIGPDGSIAIVWSSPEPVPPEPYPNSRSAEEWREFLHDLYRGWGERWSAPVD